MGTATGDCTPATCPVPSGFLLTPPTLEGSAFMLAAFAVLVPVNIVLGVRYRTPLYSTVFVFGLLFEILGYVGRIMLRTELASRQYFVISMIGMIMGPTFISQAAYLVLPHIFVLYGRDLSLVSRPLYLGFLFLAFSVFTLAFEAVGCSFVGDGASKGEITQGVHVLIAGLGIHLGSLIIFFVCYYWFSLRITRERHSIEPRHSNVYLSTHFKIFGLCLQLSAALLAIRTICRIVQFASGLDSLLAQSEIMTIVLDGALVLIASIILSLAHPGAAFGSHVWAETSPERRDNGSDSVPLQTHSGSLYGFSPTSHKKTKTKHGSHRQQQQQQQPEEQAPSYPPYYKPNISQTLSTTTRSRGQRSPPMVPIYHHTTPPYEFPPPQQVPYIPPGELSPRSEARSSQSSNTARAAVGLPARPKPAAQNSNVVDPDSLW